MSDIMSMDKFKTIMEAIQEFDKKRRRIGAFLEKELMEDSWCIVTLGNNISELLIDLVADNFNCYFDYQNGSKSNDIEWWLYDAPESKKTIGVNGVDIDISSLEEFYNYLVEQKKEKENANKGRN